MVIKSYLSNAGAAPRGAALTQNPFIHLSRWAFTEISPTQTTEEPKTFKIPSRPAWGAWIEIVLLDVLKHVLRVAPRVGRVD